MLLPAMVGFYLIWLLLHISNTFSNGCGCCFIVGEHISLPSFLSVPICVEIVQIEQFSPFDYSTSPAVGDGHLIALETNLSFSNYVWFPTVLVNKSLAGISLW